MIPDPATVIATTGAAIEAAKNAETILKQLNEVSERLKPFKPEVKSLRIDYLGRNSEVKYVLLIPDGIRRKVKRKIEIPAMTGFRFDEMWDLDRMVRITSSWTLQDNKWILDIGSLPSSEKYWLTMKGRISSEFLNQLVSVKAAGTSCHKRNVLKQVTNTRCT